MASDMRGKTALVTGGASGLGRAIAQHLATSGASVVISDIQDELGSSTANEHQLRFLHHDVTSEESWADVIREIERQSGRLDMLVNNAGVLGRPEASSPENTPIADWRRLFSVNAEGTFLGCRAAIPAMRRVGGGSIVNISSVAALLASPYATAYGASKAAVAHLTKSVAQYGAQFHIRCNSVHPGDMRTPLWDKQVADTARARGMQVDEVVREATKMYPLGRLTSVDDVASAVAFFLSDQTSNITGTEVVVDGGLVNCSTFLMTRVGPWQPND